MYQQEKTEVMVVDESKFGAAENFIVRQAVVFIEENCTRKITLSDAAKACYISPWHLSRLINKHLDRSFYRLLNTARVDRAKRLMPDPALRIGDISELVGFADAPHFSRVFKKLEGVSANQYRNLIQITNNK